MFPNAIQSFNDILASTDRVSETRDRLLHSQLLHLLCICTAVFASLWSTWDFRDVLHSFVGVVLYSGYLSDSRLISLLLLLWIKCCPFHLWSPNNKQQISLSLPFSVCFPRHRKG